MLGRRGFNVARRSVITLRRFCRSANVTIQIMKKGLWYCVLWVVFDLAAFAAPSAGGAAQKKPIPDNLSFRHILSDQLESIGYMTSITQDQDGFLWFGGANGLARYDGYSLVFYKHQEGVAGSLSNSYVNHLLVTKDGSLWVATQAGLNRYDANTDSFVVYLHDSDSPYGLSVNDCRFILEDSQGRMWLGTRGGFHQRAADGKGGMRGENRDETRALEFLAVARRQRPPLGHSPRVAHRLLSRE